jgi:hypothetical protein
MRAGGIWNFTRQSGNPEAGRLVFWDKKSGKALEPEFE